MTDKEKPAQSDDDEGGTINDPLTQTDVEAPRVPFETSPSETDED